MPLVFVQKRKSTGVGNGIVAGEAKRSPLNSVNYPGQIQFPGINSGPVPQRSEQHATTHA
ncbi:hypothetical protein ABER99_02985 [Paenibacillus glucanolyticus]|uniref:hypothetical protein n=1 Tax=Paenibacillus glucanolyticus TaxID=59843 RepID=UPI0013E322D6|nr:hypothetical protein [Paenibacillus glucanolyticus]